MPIVLRDKEIDPPSGYLLIGSSRPGDHTLPDIFCCSCCSLGFFRFCCFSSNGQAEEASNVSVCLFRFSKTDRNWLGPVYTSPPPLPTHNSVLMANDRTSEHHWRHVGGFHLFWRVEIGWTPTTPRHFQQMVEWLRSTNGESHQGSDSAFVPSPE